KLEPGKLPAEMTLVNKGTRPLHNVLVWHHLEAAPPPGFTPAEYGGMGAALVAGGWKFVFTKYTDRQLQDYATALGSRNLVFVPVLSPRDTVRLPYNLGVVRWCKRATFTLYSDELKVENQAIEGIKEMQDLIERRFGPKR